MIRPLHGKAWHGVDAPCYHCKRASECLLIQKERMRMRPCERFSQAGAAERGYIRTWEGCKLVKALTSGDCRGRIHQDTGKTRPCKGNQ